MRITRIHVRSFVYHFSLRTIECHSMRRVCDEFNGYGIEFVGRALKYDEDDMRSIQYAIFSSSGMRSERID